MKSTFELYPKFLTNILELIDLSTHQSLAIAVSGGADSLSLLFLMQQFATEHNIELLVITINHNLRKESKEECAYVESISKNLGLKHVELSWNHQQNFSNLHARAREARYSLMTEYCKSLGITIICTAHHHDDYIENFCIRQERKSGIFGLSSSKINFYNNILIARPLHNIQKIELIKYLQLKKVKWFEDKSNYDDKYQRSRVRKFLSQQNDEYKNQMTLQQQEINKQASELRTKLVEAIAESSFIYQSGFAKINHVKLTLYCFDLQFQVMSFILNMISGKIKCTRGNGLKLILDLINLDQNFVKTLHGCVLKKEGTKLLIYREFGKKPPLDVYAINGALWDNRFSLSSAESNVQDDRITYMTNKDFCLIKDKINLNDLIFNTENDCKSILFTLPIVKRLEKIIAIPHISYYDEALEIDKLRFSFTPSFVSRFTHFY